MLFKVSLGFRHEYDTRVGCLIEVGLFTFIRQREREREKKYEIKQKANTQKIKNCFTSDNGRLSNESLAG